MSSFKITAAITLAAFLTPIGVQLGGNHFMRRGVEGDSQTISITDPNRSSVITRDRGPSVIQANGKGMSQRELASTLNQLASDGNPERAQAAICQFLLSLSHEEIPRALPVLPDLPGFNMRYEMTEALFARWAAFDPIEALAKADELADISHRIGARSGAFRTWTTDDPGAARAYFLSLEPGEQRLKLEELYWKARRDRDPQEAAYEALQVTDASDRDAILDHVFPHWKKSNPHQAIAWLREFPDGARRDRWLEDVIIESSFNDPERAFEYTNEFFQDYHKQKILGRVLANWAFAEPEAALQRLLELSQDQRTADMVQRFSGELRDVDTARSLMDQLPESDRADFITGLSRAVHQRKFSGDLTEIGELTRTMTDEKARRYAVKLIAQGWLMHDKETALDWIRSSDAVAPKTRKEILDWDAAK